jgi:dihydrodipicolinate synthase/N-acetylneuraminate lyase
MPALLTPFDAQQNIDRASLRRLVRFNIEQGRQLLAFRRTDATNMRN